MGNRARRLWWIGVIILIVVAVGGALLIINQHRPSPLFDYLFDQPRPYPDHIDEVQPAPGREISMSDESVWHWLGWEPGDICVQILEQPLLRPGDDLYQYDNVKLTLDGQTVMAAPSHEIWDAIVVGVSSQGAYADVVCWHDESLNVGEHIAEVLVWTSTGEEFTYQWAFEVVR